MTTNLDFYNRTEYFKELARRADKTSRGDRIALTSMTFDSREPLIAQLMSSLCAAASRGVVVHLSIDAYTFLSNGGKIAPGPLWAHTALPKNMPEPYRSWLKSLEKLRANGGHYGISNVPAKPFSTPPKGRSHIKGAVINNYLLIGGCNLHAPEETDVMVGQTEANAADWLYDWFVRLATTGSTLETFHKQDQSFAINSSMKLLIDAGAPKQSIIYDHAMELIDSAEKSIFFTCQYFPGGRTAQHLLTAHKRGVKVRIVYSPPHAHGQKAFMHHLYNLSERLRLPAEFFSERRPGYAPLLHAKVVATDKGAIVGSNNYVTQGVWFGTAEIALRYDDPSFSKQLIEHINQQL